jgi:hypothetical protein
MQCSTVQLDPKDARALYTRGLAKRRNGDLTDGDAEMAAARSLDPDAGYRSRKRESPGLCGR